MKALNKLPTMLPLYPKLITSTRPSNNTTTMLELWARLASTLASFMFIWAMFSQFVPYKLRQFLETRLNNFYYRFHPYIEITIPEHSGDGLKTSEAYSSAQAYLSSLASKSARRLMGEIGWNGRRITLGLGDYERVEDEFRGAKIRWVSGRLISSNPRGMGMGQDCYYPESGKRFFSVTFHQKHRELVTGEYLKHVVKKGREIKVKNRQRKLYTNGGSSKWSLYGVGKWSHIPFEHPATFQSLAMDPEKKREIMDDLVKFSKSKDFYARIGKAWKRGYLLFGPPGSGKSTMIAAMANLLKYDVYDLELTAVRDNTELRRLLIETTSKSIIVIEDIDCSLDLTGQRKRKTEEVNGQEWMSKKKQGKEREKEGNGNGGSGVTLSGLLNFIDGIWSSSGGERIIVFTTNYVEKLDPALIRRGRMDKHIEMSYCGFEGFKILAKNYLCVEEHALFEKVEKLLNEVEITPADVAENLMPKSLEEDADWCLENLVAALEQAKEERERERKKKKKKKKKMEEETGEVMDDEI